MIIIFFFLLQQWKQDTQTLVHMISNKSTGSLLLFFFFFFDSVGERWVVVGKTKSVKSAKIWLWISVFIVTLQSHFLGEMMELLPSTDLYVICVDYWKDPSNNRSVLMEYLFFRLKKGRLNQFLWKHSVQG